MNIAPLSRSSLAACTLALLALTVRAAPQDRRSQAASAPRPPNVVLLVADDVGWNDVGFHDPEVVTPALDRLAAGGVRLERFYVSPVCSPTRQALLTGRYPIRWGMERHAIRPFEEQGLPRTEEILPEALRAGGYGSALAVGKWHLGHAYSKFHPLRQGFTEFLGNYTGAVDYYTHAREHERDWRFGFQQRPQDDYRYHTELVGSHAVQFIAQHARDEQPFFAYVPFLAAHGPNQAPRAIVDGYLERGVPEPRATHLAQVSVMDHQIGRILDELNVQGIAADTLVWFLSDNGGEPFTGASNGALRGGKGWVYEGGIRVPAVVRYPHGDLLEGTESNSLISHVDVLPTIRAVAGLGGADLRPPQHPLDGRSVLEVLRGRAVGPDKEHFAYYSPEDDGDESLSITTFARGRMSWKLVWTGADLALPPPSQASIQLYHVGEDPGEAQDVAAQHPEVVDDLLTRLAAWRALRPEDGRGLAGAVRPPDWSPTPDWDFLDQPTAANTRFMVYGSRGPEVSQEIGVVELDGSITSIGTTANGPDGFEGLWLQGIGRNRVDGLIYGIDREGQRVYQIDRVGHVIDLGAISGLGAGVSIEAADVHPDGEQLLVFDRAGHHLYGIALSSLVAEERRLWSDEPLGQLSITDLVFDSTGRVLAYDEATRRILTITEAGRVTVSPFSFNLGHGGALWISAQGDLFAYKSGWNGITRSPGLYLLDLVAGTTTQLTTGPGFPSIDGAGSFEGFGAIPAGEVVH
jgi:arylsulfatase B